MDKAPEPPRQQKIPTTAWLPLTDDRPTRRGVGFVSSDEEWGSGKDKETNRVSGSKGIGKKGGDHGNSPDGDGGGGGWSHRSVIGLPGRPFPGVAIATSARRY